MQIRRFRIPIAFALVTALTGLTASPAVAKTGSAGGAPIGDLLWASAVATVLSGLVLWVAIAHRAGRITWLTRLGGSIGQVLALPPWCALPVLVTGVSLVIADWGFYWDVAKHLDTGRDAAPFG